LDTRSSEAAEGTHIPTTEAAVGAATLFTRAAEGLDIRTTEAAVGPSPATGLVIRDIGARVGATGSKRTT